MEELKEIKERLEQLEERVKWLEDRLEDERMAKLQDLIERYDRASDEYKKQVIQQVFSGLKQAGLNQEYKTIQDFEKNVLEKMRKDVSEWEERKRREWEEENK